MNLLYLMKYHTNPLAQNPIPRPNKTIKKKVK